MRNLPDDWATTKISFLCKVNPPKPTESDNTDVTFLPMQAVEAETGVYDPSEIRKYSLVKKGYTGFIEGDILFAKITPCMENGKIVLVDKLLNKIGFGSTEFHVLRSKVAGMREYLFFYLIQKSFRSDAQRSMSGNAGQLRVPKRFLENAVIPIAPLPEQRAIVAKIERLFSELDKGIASLREAKSQLAIYRQAVLKKAFEGNWDRVALQSVSEAVGGFAFKSDIFCKEEKKYQVIRMGNIRPGLLRLNESPVFVDEVEDKVLERYLLKPNDIVVTLTGTRKKRDYGYTALITRDNLLLNQRLAYLRFNNLCLPRFFLYFSWMEEFKEQFFDAETGNVGQGNVGMKAVKETLIPLPPISQQQQIVQQIESSFSVCDQLIDIIDQSLEKAEALRQSILKKSFEGKLLTEQELAACRAEPDYSPASELLEALK